MTPGTRQMPLWCVGSLAGGTQYQPWEVFRLGEDLGLSGWTTLTAVGWRGSSVSAHRGHGESTTVGTMRTWALCAQVRMGFA